MTDEITKIELRIKGLEEEIKDWERASGLNNALDLARWMEMNEVRINELKRLCKTMIHEIEEYGGFKTSLEIE